MSTLNYIYFWNIVMSQHLLINRLELKEKIFQIEAETIPFYQRKNEGELCRVLDPIKNICLFRKGEISSKKLKNIGKNIT